MQTLTRRASLLLMATSLAACADSTFLGFGGRHQRDTLPLQPGETPELRALIDKYADLYDVPPSLVHRVIQRESRYNPSARNRSYWGLMQIALRTAKGMGYQGDGPGLLDAETNLRYGVKYLRGAWLCSDGDQDKAVYWYAHGYYYEAKRRGILAQVGMA